MTVISYYLTIGAGLFAWKRYMDFRHEEQMARFDKEYQTIIDDIRNQP